MKSPAVLGLAAALAVAVLALAVHFAPVMRPVTGPRRPDAPKPQAKPVAPPTAFEREAAMSPRELMARWEPFVAEAARRFDVPPDWIRAVIRMESGGRTLMGENMAITSSMGAMGIMQVLPQTYADMRAQYGLGEDPYDPHDNVIAGTGYLKWLFGKYGNPGMFAAYNDGPGNLEAFLNRGRELPQETHNYVSGISRMLGQAPVGLERLTKLSFTRPDGSPVEMDMREVTSVRAALAGEYAPGVATVIAMGGRKQGVRESVAAVTAALNAHGGKF